MRVRQPMVGGRKRREEAASRVGYRNADETSDFTAVGVRGGWILGIFLRAGGSKGPEHLSIRDRGGL